MGRSCALFVFILSLLGLIATKASAIDPVNKPLEMYKNCFNDAIARNSVSRKGESLIFTCSGDAARTFYDTLGQYGRKTATTTDSGRTFNVRYTDEDAKDDACYLKLVDQGTSTHTFTCYLTFTAGKFINE